MFVPAASRGVSHPPRILGSPKCASEILSPLAALVDIIENSHSDDTQYPLINTPGIHKSTPCLLYTAGCTAQDVTMRPILLSGHVR